MGIAAWLEAHPRADRFRLETQAALRRGLPAAVLLAAAVGSCLAIGANLSNAFPSESRPFGWPGAANFENGVAMVRPELVLATTLPALLLGLRGTPRATGARTLPARTLPARTLAARALPTRTLPAVAAGLLLIMGAILVATLLGVLAAAKSPGEAYRAFWVAHVLLAMAFFSIGFVAAAASPRHGPVAALGAWTVFGVLLDNLLKWRLFRTEGYANLASGALPAWFYVAQALSPVAAYRAILIVWRPGFRDYVERVALDGAAIPAWVSPTNIALALTLLWVVLPLTAAALLLRWRERREARLGIAAHPSGGPDPAAGPAGGQAPGPDGAQLPGSAPPAAPLGLSMGQPPASSRAARIASRLRGRRR